MRAFRIPSVLALVASLALLGCGDIAGPSLDELGPEFRGGPTRVCPPGFTKQVPIGVVQAAIDANEDGQICVGPGGGMADNVVVRP